MLLCCGEGLGRLGTALCVLAEHPVTEAGNLWPGLAHEGLFHAAWRLSVRTGGSLDN